MSLFQKIQKLPLVSKFILNRYAPYRGAGIEIDKIDFNNFFEIPVNVSSNIDAAVVAFFEQIADNKESAKALASAVIYTSQAQRINPMEFVDRFRNMSAEEIANYTSIFLNLNRVGTSYLGIHNRPPVSKYVQRMIRP